MRETYPNVEVPHGGPPADLTGLALVQHQFGSMLPPAAAIPAQWTAYAEHRLEANNEHGNIFNRRRQPISDIVAKVEKDLHLEKGMLQKCVTVLVQEVRLDDDNIRGANALARIYSLSAPTFVDVHLWYQYHPRMLKIDWSYSVGYKIYNRIPSSPIDYQVVSADGPPPMWHTAGGWQQVCWGFYDSHDNLKWDRKETCDMPLNREGLLDLREALFGPSDPPPSDDEDAVLAYRRKLVATVRLLFAVVGIDYQVACTDREIDEGPSEYMLEGGETGWVAQGIRQVCGFSLDRDKIDNEEDEEDEEDEDSDSEEEEEEEEEARRAKRMKRKREQARRGY